MLRKTMIKFLENVEEEKNAISTNFDVEFNF